MDFAGRRPPCGLYPVSILLRKPDRKLEAPPLLLPAGVCPCMSSEEEITQISLQLQGLTICVTRTRAPSDLTVAAASASGLGADQGTSPSGLGGYPSPDLVPGTSVASSPSGLVGSPSPGPVCSTRPASSPSGLVGAPSPEPVCSSLSAEPLSGLVGSPSPDPVHSEPGSGPSILLPLRLHLHPLLASGPRAHSSQLRIAFLLCLPAGWLLPRACVPLGTLVSRGLRGLGLLVVGLGRS